MSDERDELLAGCLAAYHARRARGEDPRVDDLARDAGDAAEEFRAVLAAEAAFDDAIEPRGGAHFPRVFGEYTLLAELGRGAIGVVYRALHRPLGREVALKVLRTGFDLDENARERFRREARAAAAVRHSNIVEILDAGTHEDHAFYSMTLVPGRSLAALARDGALPPPRELARRLAAVADALAALHAAGIVHRDVKPSNLVAAADGEFVLADFGLARTAATERLTLTGQTLGTPLYMSPEQALGETAIDGRSDVYALGATIYELVARRPPFRVEEPAALLRAVLAERPPDLASVAPGADADLVRIVMKALEKRREDRYAGAAEMRDDLLAYASGGDVRGRPVPAPVRAARRAVRLWPFAAAAAALLLGGAWWWTHRDATLLVRSAPAAEVTIDGEPFGPTPVRAALPPGPHALRLEAPGFAASADTIHLAAGETRDLRQVLVVGDPDDALAVRSLLAAVGVAEARFEERSGTRTAGAPRVTPLFPRGDVRVADVSTYRVQVDPDFRGRGHLRFLCGAEVVHEETFDPAVLDTEGALPPAVAEALSQGVRITWGFVAENGPPALADCTVVPDEAAAALDRLEAPLRGQPAAVRGQVRAHALLAAGLSTAAYREAAAVARERPSCAAAWRLMLESLARLGLASSDAAVTARRGLDRAAAK